jgi:hypothetical protein
MTVAKIQAMAGAWYDRGVEGRSIFEILLRRDDQI